METTEKNNSSAKVEETTQPASTNYNPSMPAAQKKSGLPGWAWALIGCGGCFLISIIIIGFLFIAGVFGAKKVVDKVNSDIKKSESTENSNFNNPKSINSSVQVSKLEWKVLEVKDLGSTIRANAPYYTDCKATTDTHFISVRFKVKNTGSESQYVNAPTIADSNKNKFSYYSNYYKCLSTTKSLDKIFSVESLNPGVEKTYIMYYEVSNDAKELRFRVEDGNVFTPTVDFIDLGLK